MSGGGSRSVDDPWVQKADLEPIGGKSPEQVAIDESVFHLDGERHWLYAAVNPETNEFRQLGVYNRCVTMYSRQFIAELLEKHDLGDAVSLVDGAPWLHAALDRLGCEFRHETHGQRNTIERVFKEIKTENKPVRQSLPPRDDRLRRILAENSRFRVAPAYLNSTKNPGWCPCASGRSARN